MKNKTKNKGEFKKEIKKLQLLMLRVQQGVWHKKERVIIAFEGFDAAGKGGAIRKLTEDLDPRGFRVHPIGPPNPEDQAKHWLYRFWQNLPAPGTIAIFDRSWYGRVLVERVEGLTPEKRWKEAYAEINEFEKMLRKDGIVLIKIFLSITKDEQFSRFEDRIKDPYKQWKITDADIQARKNWDQYVKAVKDMLKKTDLKNSPWHVIPADHKPLARKSALAIVTQELKGCVSWIESQAAKHHEKDMESALKKLSR